MSKRGRPKQAGERYPSGDLKPYNGAVSPAIWARMKNDGIKVVNDPRLGDQVGRLSFHGILSNAQTAAAFRVGDVFRRYHRAKRLRVNAKSPNYEQSFGSADLAEERMSEEQLEQHEASIRSATEAWEHLDGKEGLFRRFKPDLRKALIDLCVLDQPVNPTLYNDIRSVLDHLAVRWNDHFRQADKLAHAKSILNRSSASPELLRAQAPKRQDSMMRALEQVVRKLRKDLDEDGVATVKQTFLALVDRDRFNSGKKKTI